jgi:O-antigen/teichoic acid export membrane protein
MPFTKGIAGKVVQGSLYSGVAAVISFGLAFARAILMARLLSPEHFGVMALAFFFVNTSNVLVNFGLCSVYIHCPNNDESLKRTYFSVQICLYIIKTAIILAIAPILKHLYPDIGNLQEVIIALALVSFVAGLSQIQTTLFQKDLNFSSLAVMEIVSSIMMIIVGPVTAWIGWGVWALVAELASNAVTRIVLGWGVLRCWQPRFGWDRQSWELFWRLGKPTWIKTILYHLLDRFDDFWIGSALGQIPLGYYDKSYDLACAPRRVFALPLLKVFEPVFARLQHDRKRLSDAFFRSAYLLIRMVFFGAGLFALIMPEFIRFVIGIKWLPMLWTFRLLLAYAAFDSLLKLIHGLFTAVGKPVHLRNATLVQTVFFLPAVILGAHIAGINGVAIAADVMLLIGIGWLYNPLTKIIDISLWRLLGWPLLALVAALGTGIVIESALHVPLWQLICLKITMFTIIMGGILLPMEGREYLRSITEVKGIIKSRKASKGQMA